MPKKTPIDWTYKTCWNSGVQLSYLSILSSSRPVLSCPALWNIRQILRPAALGLIYHRALCLGRQDDRIRRISQASNIMGTSWIVGSDKGHNSAIRSVFLFCYRTSTSATLCQDEKYKKKNISLSAKIGFLQHFLNDETSFWLFGGKRLIAKLAMQG